MTLGHHAYGNMTPSARTLRKMTLSHFYAKKLVRLPYCALATDAGVVAAPVRTLADGWRGCPLLELLGLRCTGSLPLLLDDTTHERIVGFDFRENRTAVRSVAHRVLVPATSTPVAWLLIHAKSMLPRCQRQSATRRGKVRTGSFQEPPYGCTRVAPGDWRMVCLSPSTRAQTRGCHQDTFTGSDFGALGVSPCSSTTRHTSAGGLWVSIFVRTELPVRAKCSALGTVPP
jgi:hypothetical protein